jgi:hypothetical protein
VNRKKEKRNGQEEGSEEKGRQEDSEEDGEEDREEEDSQEDGEEEVSGAGLKPVPFGPRPAKVGSARNS